jgi:hypothetical protein
MSAVGAITLGKDQTDHVEWPRDAALFTLKWFFLFLETLRCRSTQNE